MKRKVMSVLLTVIMVLPMLLNFNITVNAAGVEIVSHNETVSNGIMTVTVVVKNSMGSSQSVGAAVIGYDSTTGGNALEARGKSSYTTNNSTSTLTITLNAGNSIKRVEVIPTGTASVVTVIAKGFYLKSDGTGSATAVIENGNTSAQNAGVAITGYDSETEGKALESRGESSYLLSHEVGSYEVIMNAGSAIKRIAAIASGNATGGPSVLSYGFYVKSDGTSSATAVIENGNTSAQNAGVALVGYDSESGGKSLEARGKSSYLLSHEVGSYEVVMNSGNRIKRIEAVPNGTGTYGVKMLGSGYYLKSDGKISATSVIENGNSSAQQAGAAAFGYNQETNGSIISAYSNYSYLLSHEVATYEATMNAGQMIKTIDIKLVGNATTATVIGVGSRREDGKVIVFGTVENGASSAQNITMKVKGLDSVGNTIEVKDTYEYTLSHSATTLVVTLDAGSKINSIDARFYDAANTELKAVQAQVLNGDNTTIQPSPFQFDKISQATTKEEVIKVLESTYSGLSQTQKQDEVIKEDAVKFAENAIEKIASSEVAVVNSSVEIKADTIKDQVSNAKDVKAQVEKLITQNQIETNKEIETNINIQLKDVGDTVTAVINKSAIEGAAGIDHIKLNTGEVDIAVSSVDIKADIASNDSIDIEVSKSVTGTANNDFWKKAYLASSDNNPNFISNIFAAGTSTSNSSYKISFKSVGKKLNKLTNNVKVGLPSGSGDPEYSCVFVDNGQVNEPVGGNYNPITGRIEIQTRESGTYYVKENKKSFGDIGSKGEAMKKAIEVMAAKGIISGKVEGKFDPDAVISRSEFTKLIVRVLYIYDREAQASFGDVKKSDWDYAYIASSKNKGLISGYENNTFRGKNTILKQEIIKICAASLNSKGFKYPTNESKYLQGYNDNSNIASWAKKFVALASREGLVVKRSDGKFEPVKPATRGDAALMLYYLFKKI